MSKDLKGYKQIIHYKGHTIDIIHNNDSLVVGIDGEYLPFHTEVSFEKALELVKKMIDDNSNKST